MKQLQLHKQNILASLELGIGSVVKHQHQRHLAGKTTTTNKFRMFRPRKDLSTTSLALALLRYNVALQIAVLAITINLSLGVVTFCFGTNALYTAFGIDCAIGVLTAAILIWRFATQKREQVRQHRRSMDVYGLLNNGSVDGNVIGGDHEDTRPLVPLGAPKLDHLLDSLSIDPNDARDHARELWSTFWLGQVMIFSGIIVIVRTVVELITHLLAANAISVQKLDNSNPNSQVFRLDILLEFGSSEAKNESLDTSLANVAAMEPLFILAAVSLALNLVLMALKILIYLFLNSNSMLIEGINSCISALFAGVAMISIRYSDSVQYLDQIVSILFGIFLVIYGGYNVMHTIGATLYEKMTKKPAKQYNTHQHHRAGYQQL